MTTPKDAEELRHRAAACLAALLAPGLAGGSGPYLRQVAALLWKDVAIELRTKDVILAVLVFSLLAITMFLFSFDLRADNILPVSPGILWVAIIFSGTLGLGRSYAHERERGSMEGLLLCPVDRSAVYVAKLLTTVVYMIAAVTILLPVFAGVFGVPALSVPIIAVILLGVIGFASVGTVFGAMAVNTRAREVMLPVLLFPVLVPLVIATVKATGMFMDGQPWSAARVWLELLVGFDAVYLVVSFIVYEFVIEDWG